MTADRPGATPGCYPDRVLTRATLVLLCLLAGCSTRDTRETMREPAEERPSRDGPADPAPVAGAAEPAAPTEQTPPVAPLRLAEVEQLIGAAIAAGKLPGAVVAVGDSRGTRYIHAFGQRSLLPARETMTKDTIFDLASLTKPVATATAIGLLVDEGKLTLDTRVAHHLKGFGAHGKAKITVRQLLLHAGGLPAVTRRADFERPRDTALHGLRAVVPERPPGDAFLYSDTGYLVLGALVEHVAGMRLDHYLADRLFGPLGTEDLRFGVSADRIERTAPTEERDERPIRGAVHDPRAYRLGGIAGNAGLFGSAADLARFARLMLGRGSLDGRRVLSDKTFEALTASHRVGDAIRTPGWDRDSPLSRLRGSLLSETAFGHGGFTGTSLWIDPERDLFVVFLSNRVHPEGKGNVIRLIGEVTDAVMRGWMPRMADLECDIPRGETLAGIDVLVRDGFAQLRGRRVGLVINAASRTRDGRRTIDALHEAQDVELKALFTPEHGLDASAEGRVAGGRDRRTGLPIHSLFGRTRTPTAAMLAGIDTLVFDLQDVGARFFTYMSTLLRLLEVASERPLRVVVLDRPNPLGGLTVEGPVLDEGIETFVNYHRLPVRHGMTAGELAGLLRAQRGLSAELQVVWMAGYRRDFLFADTGLPWRAPSPNLPTQLSALLYPATALLESTNISVGRGTDHPFEWLGAPWLDAEAMAATLTQADRAGVSFTPARRTPRSAVHRGRPCRGLRLSVTDPRGYRAVRTGYSIAGALRSSHPDRWETADLPRMVGHRASTDGLAAGAQWAQLRSAFQPELSAFERARSTSLHYPSCADGK